ncbi:MAG: YfbU family protein [Pseudomonadota bacterium]
MSAPNKTERIEIRFNADLIERIDTWRNTQSESLTRPEAVQKLVEQSLNKESSNKVVFTNAEKIILLMLCEVAKNTNTESNIPEIIDSIITGGHTWAIKSEFPSLFHNQEDDPQKVNEVKKIIAMWWYIESSFERLSEKDKEQVNEKIKPFHVLFRGFDGNSEAEHLSIAHFLIGTLGQFPLFKNRELNANFPTLDGYRRMLALFEPIHKELMGQDLDAAFIIVLINERTNRNQK